LFDKNEWFFIRIFGNRHLKKKESFVRVEIGAGSELVVTTPDPGPPGCGFATLLEIFSFDIN
jgi:hypothetical protein